MAATIMYVDVADYLATKGLGTKEVDMWGGFMPAKPDFMIGLYEHTGFEPIRAMGTRRIDVITLQIIVRAVKTIDARLRAYAIYKELDVEFNRATTNRVLNGVQYYSILARHAPFMMGQDENQRYRWTCSYIVRRD